MSGVKRVQRCNSAPVNVTSLCLLGTFEVRLTWLILMCVCVYVCMCVCACVLKWRMWNVCVCVQESILNGRLEACGHVDGFVAELAASGSFCPPHLTLPVTAAFYSLHDNYGGTSPYLVSSEEVWCYPVMSQ